jgi:chromosome partitioning protein
VRKIAFLNEKGGTGKTTIATHFAAWASNVTGANVLLIDMDPQGQVAKSMGLEKGRGEDDIFDLLVDDRLKLESVIKHSRIPGLDIVPSNKRLTDFSVNVAEDNDRFLKLLKKTADLKGYDYLVIDPPPSLGLLTLNILMTVNELYIPVALTYLALDGCAEIVDTVRLVRDNFGKNDLEISGVIPTFYRRTRLANEILRQLRSEFGNKLFDSVLKFNVRIDEAQSFGKTVFEYAPKSKGAAMMNNICEEVARFGR